jgi:demethylmenaquinone methyltransferase/2-methoxy-6-polyprenyl-1,4-benzoquinol methylase
VLGRAYTTYFRRVLPKIGQLFSRNRESAYKYLPESVMAFPDGEALCDRLRQAGLTDVTFTPMTFGVATLYIGTKPLTHG